jgi:multidrug efflux pump subunit AcrA (membrane-fusion protein)
MAEIEVFLERHKGLGVPNVAIQERAGRTVVFLVEDDVAHMVEVKTGIETDGWTEVTGLTLKENDPVVTMGQFLLEENTKVIVQKG